MILDRHGCMQLDWLMEAHNHEVVILVILIYACPFNPYVFVFLWDASMYQAVCLVM